MAYTDMTSVHQYKDLVRWLNLDKHAENSARAQDHLEDMFFSVTHSGAGATIVKNDRTKMAFNTVRADPFNTWDTTNKKWTPGKLGKYLVMLTGSFQGGSDQLACLVELFKNGSLFKRGTSVSSTVTSGAFKAAWSQLTVLVEVTAITDYFEPYMVFLGSSEDINSTNFQDGSAVDPFFTAIRIH